MDIFESLEKSFVPPTSYKDQIPNEVYELAFKENECFLLDLYYPNLYVLPITPEGEVELIRMYNEEDIYRYGAYESTLKFNDDLFTVLIVNND